MTALQIWAIRCAEHLSTSWSPARIPAARRAPEMLAFSITRLISCSNGNTLNQYHHVSSVSAYPLAFFPGFWKVRFLCVIARPAIEREISTCRIHVVSGHLQPCCNYDVLARTKDTSPCVQCLWFHNCPQRVHFAVHQSGQTRRERLQETNQTNCMRPATLHTTAEIIARPNTDIDMGDTGAKQVCAKLSGQFQWQTSIQRYSKGHWGPLAGFRDSARFVLGHGTENIRTQTHLRCGEKPNQLLESHVMRTLHQRWMQSCLVLVFHVKIPAIGDEIPISKWEHMRMIPWWIHGVDSARPRGQSHRFPPACNGLTLNAFNTVVGNRGIVRADAGGIVIYMIVILSPQGPAVNCEHALDQWNDKWNGLAAFRLGHDRPLKAGILSSKT